MAKVNGTFYTAERLRRGTTPVSPPYDGSEGQQPPVNPSVRVAPPVAIRYASEAAMIAAQANQRSGYLYFDGTNTWWYKGVANGVIGDYQEFGGGGGNFVAYDISQSLTGTQKLQALDNIGSSAGSLETFTNAGVVTINNLVITKSNIEFEGSSTVTLNGIAPLWGGQEVTIWNRTGNNLTITKESVSSTDVNRFWETLIIPNGSGVRIKYSDVNGTSTRWAIVSTPLFLASSGIGLYTLQNLGIGVVPTTQIGLTIRRASGSTFSLALENDSGVRMFEARETELFSLFPQRFHSTTGFASAWFKPTAGSGNSWCWIASEFGGANGASLKWNMIYSSKGGAFFGSSDGVTEPGANRRVRIRGFGTTTGETLYLEDSAATAQFRFLDNGKMFAYNLNTSVPTAGTKEIYVDGSGFLKLA